MNLDHVASAVSSQTALALTESGDETFRKQVSQR